MTHLSEMSRIGKSREKEKADPRAGRMVGNGESFLMGLGFLRGWRNVLAFDIGDSINGIGRLHARLSECRLDSGSAGESWTVGSGSL